MQPGRAQTSGLGVPLLLLARRVGLVAPVRPTLGLWFVVPCPTAALGAYARAVSGAPWRLFTGVRVLCVVCALSVATWSLVTGLRIMCGTIVVLVASLAPPPFFFVFLLFSLKGQRKLCGTREQYRDRHAQLEQRCSSALFRVVVIIADVLLAVMPLGCGSRVIMYTGATWCGSGWVSLCVSVKLRAGLVGVTRGSGVPDLMASGVGPNSFFASLGSVRLGVLGAVRLS